MNIYVLISTIDDGIKAVLPMLLPEEEGVRYVISWQQSKLPATPSVAESAASNMLSVPPAELAASNMLSVPPAELAARKDVTVASICGRGLCRNRNNAIETVLQMLSDPLEDAVCVIADDDERLVPEAFARIRKAYDANPKLDGALFRIRSSADGGYFKVYPDKSMAYGIHPRSYYPSSLEMTFRTRVWQTGIRFNERFGLASEQLCAGEEEVLLADILRKGLSVRIIPEDIGMTDPNTTGGRAMDEKMLRSKGAVYAYTHSIAWAFCRSWREALSLGWRHRQSPVTIFRNIWSGAKYIRS
ncbi:MAG: hypothetical protein K6F94_06750 [Bacteroidaceae bacterium]|nr:hypothetical protein [Bacteroidaceae bacterium]